MVRVVQSVTELPEPLPDGVTVVPAARPYTIARALAARTPGAVLCASVADAERVLAAPAPPRPRRDVAEAEYLQALLDGCADDLPATLVGTGAAPRVRRLREDLLAARAGLRDARVGLLRQEAALIAARRSVPAELVPIEPELVRRAARRAAETLQRARAARAALGRKPVLDAEAERAARRAMSRLTDASFASEHARSTLQRTLAVANVAGLALALVALVALVGGADLDAPVVYGLLGLAGAAPVVALSGGAAGVGRARTRVRESEQRCREALHAAGVGSPAELNRRRAELDAWLERADATAEARDAWYEARAAWQAVAGADADPACVEELLDRAGRVCRAEADAEAARSRCDDMAARVLEAEQAVRRRLEEVGDPPAPATGVRAVVVSGLRRDEDLLRRLAPNIPVALVTPGEAGALRYGRGGVDAGVPATG